MQGRLAVGVHTSIAGGLPSAVNRATALGCDCFQMFARNPRGWAARRLDYGEIAEFREARKASGLWPLVIHSVYLINLAAQDILLLGKSRQTFREEIERAVALGAEYLVVHPGNPVAGSSDAGLTTAIESIREAMIATGLKGASSDSTVVGSTGVDDGLTILIENAAGQGSSIGRTFEQMAEMLSALDDLPVGVCLDTAHAFASGYDISTAAGLKRTLQAIDNSFGLGRIKLVHCNDSKAPLGSRVDRHEHIGLGCIGAEAFRRLTQASELRGTPLILETPIEKERNDEWNMRRLRKLATVKRA